MFLRSLYCCGFAERKHCNNINCRKARKGKGDEYDVTYADIIKASTAAVNAVNAPCHTWRPFGTVDRSTDSQTWLRQPSVEPNWNQTRIWCCCRQRTCEIKYEITFLKSRAQWLYCTKSTCDRKFDNNNNTRFCTQIYRNPQPTIIFYRKNFM